MRVYGRWRASRYTVRARRRSRRRPPGPGSRGTRGTQGLRAALALAVALPIAACSSIPATPPAPRSQGGAAIAQAAASLIGTPYHFGGADAAGFDCSRSEEHTSELQSQFHLVCRLLLEKKK